MNDRARAHGRASHAVLSWLHGRPVRGLSPRRPIDHGADPAPRDREGLEEAIRLALAGAAGEMIHLGADTTHIAADRPDVQAALLYARRLPGDEPVDHIERELDAVEATLRSPRVWHAVRKLAAVLSDHRVIDGATAARVIRVAMISGQRAEIEPHPRTIHLMPGAPPTRPAADPMPKPAAKLATQANRNRDRGGRSSSTAKRRGAK
jgi:hypothetical protein